MSGCSEKEGMLARANQHSGRVQQNWKPLLDTLQLVGPPNEL